ncbi:MAG: hypothetical protein J0I34_10440 [Pseudonocardia sp.]|uniref:hypothetical protein n=1 Tax=unclassified Pseudonocardia TaxID=2619320 RepID=UPI00086CFC4A|nr:MULTISPECIES: hypothetical protein [unclassified Pseudonocardia]MBN9109193.1 hypothetical protein [Pseudonocardia sp.]ODU25305.1 MAG: hypothetical protein ABS80_10520 [Pseudonocardia sp. SCN 72-51]ODV01485.1 MAG: hypothetical protein ABT15_27490 [Pseudonocardia sp. SCN 73-27]
MTATALTTNVSTVAAAAAGSGPEVAPATRFRRRAIGTVAIVGGVLTAAGFAATVWEASASKADYLASLVSDPLRSQLAAVLLHFGYMAFIPVLVAFAAMTRRRWRVGGTIGIGLSAIGALALPGLLVTDFYDMAMRQTLPADLAVRASDAAQELPLGALVGGPFIMVMFVGFLVATIAAWRAGFAHWVMALPLVVGVALPIVLGVDPIANIASGACLGLFLVSVGVAALRMSDAQWVTGRRDA